ncbi:hypothetical protein [Mycobacterium attenuatum]|uniref:hypothetical protein n=1 Tax=Mycobacterium attenuatum TaxID=2341086 RepID=UPI000F02AEA0|nr:hypothetical protein [Mycobacterium attenuatum]
MRYYPTASSIEWRRLLLCSYPALNTRAGVPFDVVGTKGCSAAGVNAYSTAWAFADQKLRE